MNIAEQCSTCAKLAECRRAYGKYFIFRAQGWRPEWTPDDGNPHPFGCRHRVPADCSGNAGERR